MLHSKVVIMVERTLGDEIVIIVDDRISRLPVNLECTISKVYKDGFVDVIANNEVLSYIKCIGSPKKDREGVVVFINNDFNNPIVICKSASGGGSGDFSEYVKKEDLLDNTQYDIDLNLNFGLSGLDDSITINMDIVDHIVNKTINTRS